MTFHELARNKDNLVEQIQGWFLAVIISTSLFLFIWLVLGIALFSLGDTLTQDTVKEPMVLLLFFGFCILGIASGIIHIVYLYKLWSIVPRKYRHITPGAAVGYLFIPIYNLYWLFHTHLELGRNMNKTLGREKVSITLLRTWCVIYLVSNILIDRSSGFDISDYSDFSNTLVVIKFFINTFSIASLALYFYAIYSLKEGALAILDYSVEAAKKEAMPQPVVSPNFHFLQNQDKGPKS